MTQTPAEFPKIIYAFWMQGRKNAPEIVRVCLDRWQHLNPDYKLIVLDRDSAQPYLADFPIDASKLAVQGFSDILRVQLLAQTGGVWTDASVFPTAPLSAWLTQAMNGSGFFAHADDNPKMPIGSWFLAAEPNALIMQKWCDLMRDYWFMERKLDETRPLYYQPENPSEEMRLHDLSPTAHYPYFWQHHLFAHLLQTDAEFAALWAKTQKLPTDAAHEVQIMIKSKKNPLNKFLYEHGLMGNGARATLQAHLANTHMHKLNWRKRYPINLLNRTAQSR